MNMHNRNPYQWWRIRFIPNWFPMSSQQCNFHLHHIQQQQQHGSHLQLKWQNQDILQKLPKYSSQRLDQQTWQLQQEQKQSNLSFHHVSDLYRLCRCHSRQCLQLNQWLCKFLQLQGIQVPIHNYLQCKEKLFIMVLHLRQQMEQHNLRCLHRNHSQFVEASLQLCIIAQTVKIDPVQPYLRSSKSFIITQQWQKPSMTHSCLDFLQQILSIHFSNRLIRVIQQTHQLEIVEYLYGYFKELSTFSIQQILIQKIFTLSFFLSLISELIDTCFVFI